MARQEGRGMKVLIACHAGVGVGLGHLSRSLVVAKVLQARFDADIRWLIQSDPFVRHDLNCWSHRWVAPDQDLVAQLVAEGPVDLVLLDLQPQRVPPHLGQAITRLRAKGAKVIAVDGLLAWRPDLDLIFIPSFQFSAPAGMMDRGAPIVYGWDCFLLDMEQTPVPWEPGRNVLALTGGSDVTRLGATWPMLLDETLPSDVTVHWVTGPFAERPHRPLRPRVNLIEHVAPPGLAPLMRQTNYAVTVFGVSFFELLCMGVPTVVFSPYGGKDSSEMSAIANSGVALVAADEREATTMLKALLAQDELAQRLSKRALETLGGGHGAERLCAEILDCMTH